MAGCIGTDDVHFSSKNIQWDRVEWAYVLPPLRAKYVAEGTAGGVHDLYREICSMQIRVQDFSKA